MQVEELNDFVGKKGVDAQFRCTGEKYQGEIKPVYFTGNPELLDSIGFFVVVSLNPKYSEDDAHVEEYILQNKSFDDYYLYYSNYFHLSNHLYYSRFWDPLGLLISSIKSETVDDDQRKCLFNTCFSIELIPFYSSNWHVAKTNLGELYELKCMFYIKQIRHLLFNQCKPAAILANGKDTIRACEVFMSDHKTRDVQFKNGKRSWIKQGLINGTPFFGFPFLRKPSTANSNKEIIELGKMIRQFI